VQFLQGKYNTYGIKNIEQTANRDLAEHAGPLTGELFVTIFHQGQFFIRFNKARSIQSIVLYFQEFIKCLKSDDTHVLSKILRHGKRGLARLVL